jgi:uncharacterized membrane protein
MPFSAAQKILRSFYAAGAFSSVAAAGLLFLFYLGNAYVFAASPADYKQRIESARFGVEQMLQELDSKGSRDQEKIVSQIRSEVPVSEKVEWPGGSIETQNGWLAAKLKDLTDTNDEKARREILVEVSERLLAISESAGDLDKTVIGERTKDQDKQKLAEILNRQEYQKPEAKEESLFQKWWREFTEWLVKMFPRPNIEPGKPSGFESLQFGLQVLIFVIVAALIVFLFYRFLPFFTGRSRKRDNGTKNDRVILGERILADESAAGLFSEAEQLAREGNLRSAIRKGYIAALCDLSDRKIVRLARHKTNRDYLRDVRKNETLFENMRGLTSNFENNWYGLRTAEQADWEDFRERYLRTIADVRRLK